MTRHRVPDDDGNSSRKTRRDIHLRNPDGMAMGVGAVTTPSLMAMLRYDREVFFFGRVQEVSEQALMSINFTHIPNLVVERD